MLSPRSERGMKSEMIRKWCELSRVSLSLTLCLLLQVIAAAQESGQGLPVVGQISGSDARPGKSLAGSGTSDPSSNFSLEAREFYNRGTELQHYGATAEAVAALSAAIRLEPSFAWAYNNLGTTLMQANRMRESVKALKTAIEIAPGFVEAHRNLGVVYFSMGEFRRAAESLREAIRLFPGYYEAMNDLGVTLLNLGKTDEAYRILKSAAALSEGDSEIHNNLGCVFARLKKWNEAFREFEKAIELDPRNERAYLNLLRAMLARKDRKSAVELYGRLRENDPTIAASMYAELFQNEIVVVRNN